MENESKLPFKVGELAEAKSFQIGYRGAWFRCKIREISKRKGHIGHALEYYDFPDEKVKWTKLYQVPFYAKEKHRRELMLRPRYPPIYNEKEMPHVSMISEAIVVVHDSWRVGDLVDWWTTGCYWSGRIIQLLGDDNAKIELKPPPLGEGSSYDVLLKDVRPSLDWSPENGWILPTQEGDTGPPCARLIKPITQVIGRLQIMDTHNSGRETEAGQGTAGSPVGFSISSPLSSNSLAVSDEVKNTGTMNIQKRSLGTIVSKEVKDVQENITSLGCGDSSTRKTFLADTESGETPVGHAAAEVAKEDLNSSCSPRASGGITLNSMCPETFEAAVLDLQECLNTVKYLKAILNGNSSSDAPRSKWEYVDPPASSHAPK